MNCSLDYLHHLVRERESYVDYHNHPNYELVYYVNGKGTTEIGKNLYRYDNHTFTLIQPGCMHNEFHETETEVIFICFYYNCDPVILKNGIYHDTDGTLYRILMHMLEEMRSRKSFLELAIHGLLCQMIALAARLSDRTVKHEAGEKIKYAKKYLEQYCSEKIDLKALAHNLGFSYDYFRHIFKRSTGYSPAQYMIQNRFERAKKMLLGTDKKITDIALECGFSNTPQFSMMFRKNTGMTPKTFRDQYKSQMI